MHFITCHTLPNGFYFLFLIRSGAARQQQSKNETPSKTKTRKYVRATLKDRLKTADVRKFRVAPVSCRGLHCACFLQGSSNSTITQRCVGGCCSTRWAEPSPKLSGGRIYNFQIFFGAREREGSRMVLVGIAVCGRAVGFDAARKRKADKTPVPGTVPRFG